MSRQSILAVVLLLSIVLPGLAQTPQPSSTPTPPVPQKSATGDDKDEVVRITTNLVQVDVVVTKDGRPFPGLKAEDFEIFEDGHPQNITNFAYVSNVGSSPAPIPAKSTARATKDDNSLPPPSAPVNVNDPHRTIAIVVDDLGLSAESMAQVRRQLHKFVDEQLQSNDLVAIIRTGGDMGSLQQFTNDRRLLQAAVDRAHWNPCSRVGVHVFAPAQSTTNSSGEESACGGYSVGNTIRSLRFILKSMAELPGRKAMVLLSDSLPREEQEMTFQSEGDDTDSSSLPGENSRNYYLALQKLAELAIRSSVVIYGIDTQGLQYTGVTAADRITSPSRGVSSQITSISNSRSRLLWQRREGTEILTRETGGFLVQNSNDFKLERVLEDQQGYYLIGYRPTEETFNQRFHHIKARVKGSGLTLRTRFGFYGITEDDARNARTPADKTSLALVSPFGAHEIALDLTAFFANNKTSGSVLRCFVLLNAKDLAFAEDAEGWHKDTVEINGIIFGNNGQIVDQFSHNTLLSIRGQTYERALRDGISLQFDMPVKRAGSYQLRVAALDLASSHIGAAGQFVSVPDLTNQRLALSGVVLEKVATERNSAVMTPSNSSGVTTKAGDSWSQNETGSSPAVRRFSPGALISFACVIYNATPAPDGHPKLTLQARLFRDGKPVDGGEPQPIDVSNQPDLARIMVGGVIRLKDGLQPGKYFLQVVVNDTLAKKKDTETMQWIDFDIVKP